MLVAFGANVGDPRGQILRALDCLAEIGRVQRVSRLYGSAPMYQTEQPPFVNGAALLETDLGPFRLLYALKAIEVTLGRQVRARNDPREIDLDLVAFGQLSLRSDDLTLPHPRLGERRFVLEPLAEIAPQFWIPGLGRPAELLASTLDQELWPLEG